MARKKVTKTGVSEVHSAATRETALELANMFNDFAIEKFGALNPPSAYVTPSGIKPLDALLGGGFISSAPIAFSSTPETGKSSIAYQMAKQFLDVNLAGICVYCDVESISDIETQTDESDPNFSFAHESRADTFGLTGDQRFIYCRRPFTISAFFEYLDGLIERKRQIQAQTGTEVKLLIILDSIASLSYSRLDSVEDFDKIPGKRAMELSFHLTKFKQHFAFDRISMIVIDQMKAAMSLKGLYDKPDEKTVGNFNNTKAATGVYTFQHAVSQWLYFSKGTELTPGKFPSGDIDGWIINVLTEKNKCASSKNQISVVFDKRTGINKFWSEFYFLSNYTPSEVKLQRDGCRPFMDLAITSKGAYTILTVMNPDSGEVEYQSKGFYRKDARIMYDEDPEFHKWFDLAVDYSCNARIIRGLLKINNSSSNSIGITNNIDNGPVEEDPIASAIKFKINTPVEDEVVDNE